MPKAAAYCSLWSQAGIAILSAVLLAFFASCDREPSGYRGRIRPLIDPYRYPPWAPTSEAPNLYLHLKNCSEKVPRAEVLVELFSIDCRSQTIIGQSSLFYGLIKKVGDWTWEGHHSFTTQRYNIPPGCYDVYAYELQTGTVGYYYKMIIPATGAEHLSVWFFSNTYSVPYPYFNIRVGKFGIV